MKLISWNVNGVRAAVKKGFLEWLEKESPDVMCIQETKAHVVQLNADILHPGDYMGVWSEANRKGYSGTATFSKQKPLFTQSNFEEDWLDEEGRVVLTEFEDFYLFNVYFPNGGSGAERLKYKLDFYEKFFDYIELYREKGKGVIICGDVNTAHKEIDLARPKENEKTSGFLPEERAWLDKLIANGYHDTLRMFTEDGELYSWWDMKTRSRDRNVGWRIDYFLVSDELKDKVKAAGIMVDTLGSDHAPVWIELRN
jgi:exodeoxyribonuclease-3